MKDIKWNDAPEWADQCLFCEVTQRSYWANSEMYTNTDISMSDTIWEFKKTGGALCDFKLTETRPVQESEWSPSAGNECEVRRKGLINAEWLPIRVVGIDCGVLFGWTGKEPAHLYVDKYELRQLKTAEEKKREAFHLSVIDACMGIHKDDFNIDEIAGALYHAQFTAPKGGE